MKTFKRRSGNVNSLSHALQVKEAGKENITKEIISSKEQIENNKKEKTLLNKSIKESKISIPSLKTDLNLNKYKYSKLLEEYQNVEKDNFIKNEKMYGEIIEYGNKVRILEERKDKLKKFKEEEINSKEKMNLDLVVNLKRKQFPKWK